MSEKKLYLIDDDPVFRLVAKKIIEKNGTFGSVDFFRDGKEGIESLKTIIEEDKNNLPDAIYLDIEMPIMNGWEFMDEFLKLPEDIRSKINIFIVTSSISNDDKDKAASYPEIKKYITKPLDAEKLNETSMVINELAS